MSLVAAVVWAALGCIGAGYLVGAVTFWSYRRLRERRNTALLLQLPGGEELAAFREVQESFQSAQYFERLDVALKVLKVLQGDVQHALPSLCQEARIVGSVRRGVPHPNDVDILMRIDYEAVYRLPDQLKLQARGDR